MRRTPPAVAGPHLPVPLPRCRDADRVALAYTEDTEWRNRAEFIKGRDAVREVRLVVVGWWGLGAVRA